VGIALRRAAGGGVDDAPIEGEPHHRHAVLRHRPRLVRADHRGGAQRLHGGQAPHEGPAAGEAPEPGGERHRRDGGEALGDGGHREADGRLEHQPDRLPVEDAREPDDPAHGEREPDEAAAEGLDLALERGRPRARERDELPDAAELGREAGGRHHREPAPPQHGGGEVDHRPPLGERRVGIEDGVGILVDGIALPGEGGLAHAQRGAPREPRVGGHPHPRLEHDEVAGHQLGARHLHHRAAASHERARHREPTQPGHRDPRAPLGGEADGGVEDEGGEDGDGLRALAEDPRDAGAREEQEHDEAPELGEGDAPEGRLRVIADAIGPDAQEPLARLGGGEPGLEVRAEMGGDRRAVERVPGFADHGCRCTSHRRHGRLIRYNTRGPA